MELEIVVRGRPVSFKSTVATLITKTLKDVGIDVSFNGETILTMPDGSTRITVEETPQSVAQKVETMPQRIEGMKRRPMKVRVITELVRRGDSVIRNDHAG